MNLPVTAIAAAHRRTKPCSVSQGVYVVVSYGIHHCVIVVTDRRGWANGVLLRAVALPEEPKRTSAEHRAAEISQMMSKQVLSVTICELVDESPAFGVVSTDFTRLHGAFSGIKK